MRVLVTGAGGQLGRALRWVPWGQGVEVVAASSADLDITDRSTVLGFVEDVAPRVIVNAAAYTAVDRAERDEGRATEVNGVAVGHLAEAADEADALLVQVSTDYVFDGTKDGWYVEGDPTGPVSAYGRSKLVGESAAIRAERSVVLRTAWLYGAVGANFVTTILGLARERDELAVVSDQVGCPTAAGDLAAAIVELVRWSDGGTRQPPSRVYHLASPEPASWYELARAVLAASSVGFAGACRPITSADHPTPARRPANSRLDSGRIRHELGIALPPWHRSLPPVVAANERSREEQHA
jgi:dTDP-4-dehydrorhamnose reductase